MPKVSQHPQGAPCWFELGTTDQEGAKQFYSQLFGWSINDSPMGMPGAVYTIFRAGSDDVGGGYTLMPDMVKAGIPPNWLVYFATASADQSSARVKEFGGSLRANPFDVMDHGRIAICSDPGDAVFALWQPKQHQGAGVINEPGSVCWTELLTRDISGVPEFYRRVFGWDLTPNANMPSYIELSVAGRRFGGIMPMDEQWAGVPPHWGVYFMTPDCDASVAKLKELGGTVRQDPFTAEGVGRMAMVADPQGASFALYAAPPK